MICFTNTWLPCHYCQQTRNLLIDLFKVSPLNIYSTIYSLSAGHPVRLGESKMVNKHSPYMPKIY